MVSDTVTTIVKEFNGRLDVFIANSGVPWTQGPMVDADLDHYRKVVTTDIDGTFYCARAAAAHWKRQKEQGTDINGNKLENFSYGSFVATASMSGHIVNFPQLQAAYNAAKAAVIHLCKYSSLLYMFSMCRDVCMLECWREGKINSISNHIPFPLSPHLQANPSPSNGCNSRVPTPSRPATLPQSSPTSSPPPPRISGEARSPWVVRESPTSLLVHTCTLRLMLLVTQLEPILSLMADMSCHDQFLCWLFLFSFSFFLFSLIFLFFVIYNLQYDLFIL